MKTYDELLSALNRTREVNVIQREVIRLCLDEIRLMRQAAVMNEAMRRGTLNRQMESNGESYTIHYYTANDGRLLGMADAVNFIVPIPPEQIKAIALPEGIQALLDQLEKTP